VPRFDKTVLAISLLIPKVGLMTRKKWTTNDQEAWLKSRSSAFAAAESDNTRKAFFQGILKEWVDAYPNPDPTPEQVQKAGGLEQAIQKNVHDLHKVNLQLHLSCHVNGLTITTAYQSVVP